MLLKFLIFSNERVTSNDFDFNSETRQKAKMNTSEVIQRSMFVFLMLEICYHSNTNFEATTFL